MASLTFAYYYHPRPFEFYNPSWLIFGFFLGQKDKAFLLQIVFFFAANPATPSTFWSSSPLLLSEPLLLLLLLFLFRFWTKAAASPFSWTNGTPSSKESTGQYLEIKETRQFNRTNKLATADTDKKQ